MTDDEPENTQTEIHNRLARELTKTIIMTPRDAGGSIVDALVILESVVLGVALAASQMAGENKADTVIDLVMAGVKRRLAEMRLKELPVKGRA